ncbi:hypothetical protein Q7M02_05525 (plasmid) [Candidatus Liberibacter asiaticus]
MGALKNHFHDEINENFYFHSHPNADPDISIEMQISENQRYLDEEISQSNAVVDVFKRSDSTILDKLDAVDDLKTYISLLQATAKNLKSLLKEYWEESLDGEDDEEIYEHPDQEHREDYYANQI